MTEPRPLRVLWVTPKPEFSAAMIFIERQIESLLAAGVNGRTFYLYNRMSFLVSFYELLELRAEIREFQPDIIHAQYGTVTAFLASLATSRPLVVTYRGSDLNPDPEKSRLRCYFGRFMSQIAAWRADRIVCVSPQLRQRIWWGKHKVTVIPSGIDTRKFCPQPRDEARAALGWDLDELIVFFNGSHRRVKRYDLALAAVEVARRHCGPISLMDLDGAQPPELIPLLMNASDCLILTSDHEGSPNVVKEAIAIGLPVVSRDVGDVRKRLAGVHPSIVTGDTPEELGAALAEILTRRQRSNGPEVVGEFSMDGVAESIVSLYKVAVPGNVNLAQKSASTAKKPECQSESSELQPAQAGENRPRKILYVTATLPYGSGESFLIPEVKELLRLGYDVRIVPRSPDYQLVHQDAAELQEHCVARSLFCWDVVKGALKEIFLRPRGAFRALAVLFRSRNWKTFAKNLIVYPKGLWLGGMARSWRADHIHVHWASTPATIGMVASIVSRTPWSCTAHRSDIAMNNLLAEKQKRATFVRFISQSGWRMAESLGAPPDPRNAEVMHLGANLPSKAEIPSSPGPGNIILCPANLYPVKGHRYLIEAIALLRKRGVECKLLIAGGGSLRPELEAQVWNLGLADAVQFLGQLSHCELLAMYRKDRVGMVVLPSVDLGNNLHEGIPVGLIEAMSYNIPVIGTRTGGTPELLEGGAGLIVPDKNPAALADAIEHYVRDPAFAAEVARKGREQVDGSFNVLTVVSQLLERIFPPVGSRE